MLLSELLPLLDRDHAVGAVALVADQHLCHVGVCMLVNLLEPVGDVVECLLVG